MDNPFSEKSTRVEIIAGKYVHRSSRALIDHHRVVRNISRMFADYLVGKRCECFGNGVDLYLNDKNWFVPDVMLVGNPDMIKANGIYGAPDLVVEVLSPSTMYNDRGPKKKAYASAGVKEYWLVTPAERSVEVYLNHAGVFELDDAYVVYPEADLSRMDDEEKAAIKPQIKVSLYDGLLVNVKDIFYRL